MKRRAALFLATVILLAAVGFCPTPSKGDITPELLLEESYKRLFALESVHLDMDLSMKVSLQVSFAGRVMSLPMATNVAVSLSLDQQRKPFRFQGELTAGTGSLSVMEELSRTMLYGELTRGAMTSCTSNSRSCLRRVKRSEASSAV